MSHIFDALLKSETEQAGSSNAARASITDVLKQAERRAAAQWKPKSGEHATHEKPNGDVGIAPIEATAVTPVATAAVQVAAPPADESKQAPSRIGIAVLEEPLTSDFQRVEPLSASTRLVTYADKGSPGAEAFRLLAVRLRHIRKEKPVKKLLITSTVPQEGKSLTSANLACALSMGGTQKVLLLEGDIRRPSQAELFAVSGLPGLCDWLQGRVSLEKCIYRVTGPEFCILPCGHVPDNPLDLIQSAKMAELLEQMKTLFDWIIIDSPPVLPLADTSILAKLADGIVLVARRGVTEKKYLERGVESLEKSKLLGTVINSSRRSRHDDYYYRYGARGSSHATGSRPDPF